jgi:vacuolar-type H+-ATPase subunit E/Vma4
MGTIFEVTDWLDDNRDRILLTHSLGKELVRKIEDSGCTYKVNENGSVIFDNCSEELLEEIRNTKKK